MGNKPLKIMPSIILHYLAQHICWEAYLNRELHFLHTKKVKTYQCKLCLNKTKAPSLNYIYICTLCQQYFCLHHCIDHYKLNQIWSDTCNTTCISTEFKINSEFMETTTDKQCRKFARNLRTSAIIVDRSEWSLNKKLFTKKCVAFMKARTIKKFSQLLTSFWKSRH